MIHLTEKAVELTARSLNYSSRSDENLLDLFKTTSVPPEARCLFAEGEYRITRLAGDCRNLQTWNAVARGPDKVVFA
jgi:hypothetical protein